MKDYNNLSKEDGEILVNTARKIVTEYIKNNKMEKIIKEIWIFFLSIDLTVIKLFIK